MTRRCVLIVLIVGLLGLVVASVTGALPVVRTAGENKAAAEGETRALLGFVSVPAGATQVAVPPPEAGGMLDGPPFAPATPDVVDQHAIWVVPRTIHQVLGWVRTHLPAQAKSSVSKDITGGRKVLENEAESFGWPPIQGVLASREVFLSAVRLPNGSTALRADAQVVWITPRSPSEVIPAGARVVRIVEHTGGPRRLTTGKPVTITALGKIALLRGLVNALPVGQPGTEACPSDSGNYVAIMFYKRRGGKPLATADADPEGCGGVALTIDGKREPQLEGADELLRRIERQLGLRLLHKK